MAKKTKILFDSLDPQVTPDILEKDENGDSYSLATETPLIKGILESLNRIDGLDKVKPLAFEEDPTTTARYAGVFYDKLGLMPDRLLKRVSMTDDLIGNILTIRGNQASPFGRILGDRFSYGFRIEPVDKERFKALPAEKRAALIKKIKAAQVTMFNCGKTTGLSKEERTILPTFLKVSARNGLLFGRIATEVLYTHRDGKKEFHSFRARDSGTIYKALPKVDSADHIRKQAIQRLAELKNEKVDPRKYEQDEYTWFQVINGTPVQGFGPEEMLVHNFFPCTDIELNGYPITPIDNALAAITTHINITSHNKLYFQNGRAAKGMLVIQSDSVDTSTISDLRQQFQATVNSVTNSWRTPVFKVGKEDDIQWRAIDQGGRDMEFQFLYDSNCRVVMATFQISPDEVPGFSHLSKGTTSQSLSEENSEYKLEAARDVGIRPMLINLQDFLSFQILPLVDEEVAEHCTVKFYGLESESPEKERTAIQESMGLWGTMDDINHKVEKETFGKRWGGEFPLNPEYQAVLDKYFTVGEIKEHFFGIEGASKDKAWAYCRDPFYFQNLQLVMQKEQMDQQQDMAKQQLQQQESQDKQEQTDKSKGNPQDKDSKQPNDLDSNIDQVLHSLHKSEKKKSK